MRQDSVSRDRSEITLDFKFFQVNPCLHNATIGIMQCADESRRRPFMRLNERLIKTFSAGESLAGRIWPVAIGH